VRSSVDERPLLEAVDEGVLTLTLNRPEQRNALDGALRDALARALDEAASDPEVRAVVLTGAGGAFCAGGDLGSFGEHHDARVLEKPVIAAIDGGVTRLVKLVRLARAKEALLGGDDLDAGEALVPEFIGS
jgi:enoyl-CoA hydratase/carnithine racemase